MEACFNTPHKKNPHDSLLFGSTSSPSQSRHAYGANDSPGTPSGAHDRYICSRAAQDNSLSNFLLTTKENMTPVMLLSHSSPPSDPMTSSHLLASSPLHIAAAAAVATAARSHRRHARHAGVYSSGSGHARRRETHGSTPHPSGRAGNNTYTAAGSASAASSTPSGQDSQTGSSRSSRANHHRALAAAGAMSWAAAAAPIFSSSSPSYPHRGRSDITLHLPGSGGIFPDNSSHGSRSSSSNLSVSSSNSSSKSYGGGRYAGLDMETYTTKLARTLFSDAPQTSVLALHNYRDASPVGAVESVSGSHGNAAVEADATTAMINATSTSVSSVLCNASTTHHPLYPSREAERFNSSVGVVYEQNRACNFTSSHFRVIAQTPERILDAADLIDDFYLNLIDWSVTNMLCVALQSVVYLWEAATCNITRLPSTRTVGSHSSNTICSSSSSSSRSGAHGSGNSTSNNSAVVVCSVQWAADGRHLAIGYHDGVVEVWDVTVPQVVRRWSKHQARVGCLSWCGALGHTCLLASGSKDASVRVQDVREPDRATGSGGGTGCVTVLRGHTQEVCGLRWSPTGVYLASGGNDNQLLVWDRRTLVTQGGQPDREGCPDEDNSYGWEGDERHPWWASARASWDGGGRRHRDRCLGGQDVIHDYYRGTAHGCRTGGANSTRDRGRDGVEASAESEGASNRDDDNCVNPWPAVYGHARLSRRHRYPIAEESCDAEDDGDDADKEMEDADSAEAVGYVRRYPGAQHSHAHPRMYNFCSSAGGRVGRVGRELYTDCVKQSHSHSCIVRGGGGTPRRTLLRSRSGLAAPFASVSSRTQPLLYLNRHTAAVKAIAWNPRQPALLASGGGTDDKTLRFWNTETGECVHHINTHSQVCGLLWSLSGTELVSSHGFSMNQLTIWKYPSMRRVAELHGHTSRVLHLCMSSDGEVVVSAAGDETIRFWRCFPPQSATASVVSPSRAASSSLFASSSSSSTSPYAAHSYPYSCAYRPHQHPSWTASASAYRYEYSPRMTPRYSPRGLLGGLDSHLHSGNNSNNNNNNNNNLDEVGAAVSSLERPSSPPPPPVLPTTSLHVDASPTWPLEAETSESDGLSGTATADPESGDRFTASATMSCVARRSPTHAPQFGGTLPSCYPYESLLSGDLPLR